ncbi:MAG: hypothetical protein RI964_225 [Pseudomonadota bacterium]|jgi:NADH-quinone oxidoreductase subunit M
MLELLTPILLSFLIWLPIFGGLSVLLVGGRLGAKQTALGITAFTFFLSLLLYAGFDVSKPEMQFVQVLPWIDTFHINYALGVDGIAVAFIIQNTLITLLIVAAAWDSVTDRQPQYLAAFLILEGILNGVFAAQDAMLFYIFFEAMLIPLFLLIGMWGGERRSYATLKMFLYTLFGSVFLLVSLVYLYNAAGGTFALADLQKAPLGLMPQILVLFGFLIAFGVKVPMWPVHTWLPDVHEQAPIGVSVILAVKVGGYAFLRFVPIVPDAAAHLAWLMVFLALTAITYVGFVALVQQDMRRLMAYSTVAHMGFVILGIFVVYGIAANVTVNSTSLDMALVAVQGAVVQMISHGFIGAALFLIIGALLERMNRADMNAFGGVINRMPILAAFFVFFAMANSGLPGTSGFVGEFMVIVASFKANVWIAIIAATTLVIGAAYMLWMVKRVVFGDIQHGEVAELFDLNQREWILLSVLTAAVLLLGIYPQPLTDLLGTSVQQWVAQALQTKCGGSALGACQ